MMRHPALILVLASAFVSIDVAQQNVLPRLSVTVSEGTSMSVAISPDGSTLAIDLQGSIWTMPSSGGPARRITDVFNDARQPVWSPDGKLIAFFGFRDGDYDIWAVSPDGTGQHQLTWGPFDDREPIWSHDGSHIAFSSDRSDVLSGNYNIWTLERASGEIRQLTTASSDDYMPSWSPDDREIAFASARDGGQSVWAVNVADGAERRVSTALGTVDAPSWSPGGQIVYHVSGGGQSRLETEGRPLTGAENAFAFRASWASPAEFVYVSDGQIRRRRLAGGEVTTVPFTATLEVVTPEYARRVRDFDSTTPRQVLGVVRPTISPDGTTVAFAAVGDIYVMRVGSKPENLTKDRALDTDPAWSPDGSQLVYSSDRGGGRLQLWVHELRTGQSRQLTRLTTQPMGATWSPDGTRIAFFGVDGMWRRADVSIVDVATGAVAKVRDSLFGPGIPTWSPDGARLAIAMVAPYSARYREGTNQILTLPANPAPGAAATAGSGDAWYAPVPTLSIDSRGGGGPVWAPDGTRMAAIYEGVLAVWPVTRAGRPLGPPRRITTESAHAPSWAGDSRHILYQSLDKLRIVDIETGEQRDVPLDLTYTPDIPQGRIVVHAGTLLDMTSATPRTNVDIVIEGNRIRSIEPHVAGRYPGAQLVDASNLTVLPGLVEFHSHLQKDFGEAQARAWLAFGITTVRSPGNTPYEAVEDREANESGVRPGPRVYGTGYLMEWKRVYYKMGIAISSPAQFEMELERAKLLQHDLIKSYVRLPDLQQRRMVEFAHGIGIPVATHEIYPASLVGVDNTEHTAATSRRGYSPKMATLQQSYDDVIQLFGRSGRIFCPMISGGGTRKLFEDDPSLKNDPRFALYPEWVQQQVAAQPGSGNRGGGGSPTGGSGKMVIDAMRAGALIVAGTDGPNGINLHGELMAYTMAGMSPFDALKAATVNPAKALGLDAGTIETGKLADLIMVEGNPLADISSTRKVRRVIANGRLYESDQLIARPAAAGTR
jgi:Tol biopolymer transport system component